MAKTTKSKQTKAPAKSRTKTKFDTWNNLSPYAKSPKDKKTIIWHRIKNYWFNRKGAIKLLKIAGIGIAGMFVIMVALVLYFIHSTPHISNLYAQKLGGSITFYDRTGKTVLWQDYSDIKRVPVNSNQIANYMKEATVAIEDKHFYTDSGFNVTSIIRAGLHDVLHLGHGLQGASTITEQVAKLNEGWADPLTIPEKIKEIILGAELSSQFTKSQILTAYLNIAPYGNIEYGVQSASEDYFHEPASKLSLAQAAFMAAIPQAPTVYSPYSSPQFNPAASVNYFDPSALLARQHYVLDQMVSLNYITPAQAAAAKAVNILGQVQPLTPKFQNVQAPYFVLAAKQQLEKQLGTRILKSGAWKVITTLNIAQQNEAQNLVQNNLSNVMLDGADEEAMVVENVPTGQVTALIGGVNFNNPVDGQINYAMIPINPGSTYKLYDYTALINDNNNVGAGSVLYDVQQPLPGYPCTNKALPLNGGNCLYDYDFQYPGPLSLRYALAGSRNVPAVKAMLINGEQKTISLSEKMGLTNGYNCYANAAQTIKTTCYGSAAIGEGGYLDLYQNVNGFATDSRLGNYIPQTFILKVTNASGQAVYQWKQPQPSQVVKPDAAYIIDNILSDPNASYLPGRCSATNCTPISSFGWKFQHTNGWDVAIKTGTSHGDETGLMMGMTTQYAVGSWVGYHTATKPLISHYGGLEGLTEPLTRGMITYLTANQKPVNWQQPAGIKRLPAFVVNNPPAQVLGHYYGWVYPSPSTDLYPSWYTGNPSHSGVVIDKVSGLLATSCTPPLAKEYISSISAFSIDTFYNSNNLSGSIPKASDNIHNCSDAGPSISITSVTCDDVNGKDNCSVNITADRGTYPLSGGSYITSPAGSITFMDNGQSVEIVDIPANTSPYQTSVQINGLPNASTLTARIVDSVLYSNTSAPVSINTSSTTSPQPSTSTPSPAPTTSPTTTLPLTNTNP